MRSTPAEAKPPEDDEPDDEPEEPPPPADSAVVAHIEARAQVYVCVPSCVAVNSVYRINLFSHSLKFPANHRSRDDPSF